MCKNQNGSEDLTLFWCKPSDDTKPQSKAEERKKRLDKIALMLPLFWEKVHKFKNKKYKLSDCNILNSIVKDALKNLDENPNKTDIW